MYKIICSFCGTENLFSDINNQPVECSNQACQNSLEGLEVITVPDEEKTKQEVKDKKITSLKLIYQKTSEEISINTDSKIILGRENYGTEILSKIKQVSRNHCSIEFIDNSFIVKDLGSTNGTFIGLGEDKISCTEPQALKEKDFLVLGQEVFLVQLLKEEIKEQVVETKEETIEPEKPKVILCCDCSCVLEKVPCSCPECGTWNE